LKPEERNISYEEWCASIKYISHIEEKVEKEKDGSNRKGEKKHVSVSLRREMPARFWIRKIPVNDDSSLPKENDIMSPTPKGTRREGFYRVTL
jgi:hypothetical protein